MMVNKPIRLTVKAKLLSIIDMGVATHFRLGGGGGISAVAFRSDQWKDMCFYGTDKYVAWLRSI